MPSSLINIDTILRQHAMKNGGKMSFRDFSKIALFDSNFGYYRQSRQRVGRTAGTDFYTAASLGDVFGKLIVCAAQSLLGDTEDLRDYTLVEIGAEPKQTHFESQRNFFREVRTFKIGDEFIFPEKTIVIANELLDAQPFHRLVSLANMWREIGIEENPQGSGIWKEVLLDDFSTNALKIFAQGQPVPTDDGWHLDISLDAENLLGKILSANWRGVAIFLDYGKTLEDCLVSFPEGTARAYSQHAQNNALTATPGEQDLTCHVLWDRLKPFFENCGFEATMLLRQESFFMKYARCAIEKIITQTTIEAKRERSTLTELIHPAKMGHAFQVLFGIRR